MYKILLIVVMSLFSTLMAQEIRWEKDYLSGVKNAQKVGKPVLFVSSRHSCKYCVVLDETTFKNAEVISKLNSEFVSIISYSDENDYMPKELWRPGTPAIWFLYPDATPMFQPLMGAMDAENFLKALNIVKEEFDKNSKSRL
jgi:thioredoxin-related protein